MKKGMMQSIGIIQGESFYCEAVPPKKITAFDAKCIRALPKIIKKYLGPFNPNPAYAYAITFKDLKLHQPTPPPPPEILSRVGCAVM